MLSLECLVLSYGLGNLKYFQLAQKLKVRKELVYAVMKEQNAIVCKSQHLALKFHSPSSVPASCPQVAVPSKVRNHTRQTRAGRWVIATSVLTLFIYRFLRITFCVSHFVIFLQNEYNQHF